MTVLLPSTAETDLAKYALSLQQLAAGRSNATGTVTLATGASSTVVSAVNCSPTSAVFLFPKTSDAAPAAAFPAFTVNKQKFTASGTYTPSAGMVYCIIECVGSGGGGGGTAGTVGNVFSSNGGGGGSYARTVVSSATVGASQSVTVGNAGIGGTAGNNAGTNGADVSVGTLCIGKGGTAGSGSASAVFPSGGAGGVAGTGDLTFSGGNGRAGLVAGNSTTFSPNAQGGDSFFGFGATAASVASSSSVAGVAASNYGAGGSGAVSHNTATTATGGNGSKGVVIITEYCFAGAASPTFVSSVGKQTFTISHDNSAVADRTYFYVCLG